MITRKIKGISLTTVIVVAAMLTGCVTDMDDHTSTDSLAISFCKLDVAGETSEPAGWTNVPSANFASKAKNDGNNKLTVQVDDFFTPRRDSVCIWDSLPTMTRGSRITSGASITNIGVSAAVYPSSGTYTSYGLGSYFYNQPVTLGVNTPYYWPTDGYKLSFFAYYPYGDSNYRLTSSAATTGSPTYTVSVPSAIADQKDFMTAQLTDRSAGVHTPVQLTFNHRMAAVRFVLANNRSSSVRINSVAVEGVYYNGTYNSSTWTTTGSVNSSSINPFTLTVNRDIASGATEDLTGTTNVLFMVPQTIPSGAKLKVTTDEDTFEMNITGTWGGGNTHTYTVTLTDEGYYVKRYLTFTALETGTFTLTIGSAVPTSLLSSVSYSTDNGSTWTKTDNVDGTTVTITTPTIAAGEKVLWKGEGTSMAQTYNANYFSQFSSTGRFAASGNIMSLLYDDSYENQKILTKNYTFCSLFYRCTGLTAAPALPATILTNLCYYGMFKGCTSLIKAPALPATTLAENCYAQMFTGCTGLTTAPVLPATTLATKCYSNMFYGCAGLTTAPALSATTLAEQCCYQMFYNCTSLTTVPALPATTLAKDCYRQMFYGCAGLTTAPALPATTLADYCYYQMFSRCTNLTTAPALPATTLAPGCYMDLFLSCSNLTTAPALPATSLAERCYYGMFHSCTSMTTAPALPATTLAKECYYMMFYGCTGLTTAPVLPATTLADGCYRAMFYNCSSLTTAPALPAVTLTESCYKGMFGNCTGLTTAPTLPATTLAKECYSQMFANTSFLPDLTNIKFVNADGSVGQGLQGLFYFTKITDVQLDAILKSKGINNYSLPATILSSDCYYQMFCKCTNLTTAPTLPATTLADNCYSYMFNNCTGLTTAPELPATTLANYCYYYMFEGCTSLTTAPELPATSLVKNCYARMFRNCSNLSYIKAAFTEEPVNNTNSGTYQWVSGVNSTGTFVKNSEASWTTRGVYAIPNGWTIETYNP